MMKKPVPPKVVRLLFILLADLMFQNSIAQEALPTDYYGPEDFTSTEKYDVHTHLNTSDPARIQQAELNNFDLLTINVDVSSYPALKEQQEYALQVVEHSR